MNLKDRYLELLDATSRRADPIGRVTQRDGVIRSALQVAALTALEVAAAMHHRRDIGCADALQERTQKLFHNAAGDSSPVALLRDCVTVLESYLSAQVVSQLRDAIKFANDLWLPNRNARAHGCGAEREAQTGLTKLSDADIRRMLEQLSPFYPHPGADGKNTVNVAGGLITLDSVPILDGAPGVVGARFRISEKGWLLPCKRCNDSTEFERIIPHDAPLVLMKEVPDPGGVWLEKQTYYVLPKGPPIFRGREEPLKKLAAWLHDTATRTAIMITGEGGIGKTALVLEFLYRQLKESSKILPNFIIFHTAKKTRWGIHGLVSLPTSRDSLDDAIRAVLTGFARALAVSVPFRPHDFAGEALLARAKRFAEDLKLRREDIL